MGSALDNLAVPWTAQQCFGQLNSALDLSAGFNPMSIRKILSITIEHYSVMIRWMYRRQSSVWKQAQLEKQLERRERAGF